MYRLNDLNAFEKCLLITVLARNQQQVLANSILKSMKDRVQAIYEGNENKEF